MMQSGKKILSVLMSVVLAMGFMPYAAYGTASDQGIGGGSFMQADTGVSAVRSLFARSQEPSYPSEGSTLVVSGTMMDDSLAWEFWDDATLCISGEGAMPNFTSNNQPWNDKLGLIEHVVISEGVTSVGSRAFSNAKLMTYVSLPETLTRIGDRAFENNEILISAHIPDAVTSIGSYAFYKCSNLMTANLPSSLEEVRDYAFCQCTNLRGALVFPDGTRSIGRNAFDSCRISSVVLNEGLVSIGECAFWTVYSSFSALTIPASVTTIGFYPFNKVRDYVAFEEGTVSLKFGETIFGGNGFFANLHTPLVKIPASVQDMPNGNNFVDCFEVDSGNKHFSSRDGVVYACATTGGEYRSDTNTDVLYWVPGTRTGAFSVPEGTKAIDCLAFKWGLALTSVSLPASLDYIYPISGVVDRQTVSYNSEFFGNLTQLERLEVDSDNESFVYEDGILYSKDKTCLYRCVEPISGSYHMPDTISTLAYHAFDRADNGITEVFFSPLLNTITRFWTVGNDVANYYLPKSITAVPRVVVTVDENSTANFATRHVFYEGTEQQWASTDASSAISLGEAGYRVEVHCGVVHYGKCGQGLQWFVDSDGLLTVLIDGAVGTGGERTMADFGIGDAPWAFCGSEIKSVEISDGISSVGANAFFGCANLASVTLSSSVGRVGNGAFANCPQLTQVYCKGIPFDVVEAGNEGASFDAETATLYYPDGSPTWEQDKGFDAESSMWNGYAVDTFEAPDLPVLSSYKKWQNAHETGYRQNSISNGNFWNTPARIAFYSETGKDISTLVDVSISGPESIPLTDDYEARFRTAVNYRDPLGSGFDLRYMQYNGTNYYVETGSCSPAGTYRLTAAPREGVTAGEPLTVEFEVMRDPEAVTNWLNEGTVVVHGGDEKVEYTRSPRIYNQYAEEITDDLSMALRDMMLGEDVDASEGYLGVTVDGKDVSVSSKAQPRKYQFRLWDTTRGRSGTALPEFEVVRDSTIINRAYSLVLSGGDDELVFEGEGFWASTPLRTEIKDAYDDPCWPQVTWNVYKGEADVTSHFDVDEQGYLHVSADVSDILDDGVTQFNIVASSPRASYYGGTVSDTATFSIVDAAPVAPATHTATFKAGGEVVGEVVFAEGDSSLEEPGVPQRENYIGAWEDYDLASATGDIKVNAVYTPIDPDAVSEVEGEATVDYNKSVVTINLAAAAATRQVKVESESTKPVDVVMVLDQSGSMADALGAGQTKRDALVECANSFAQQLYDNAAKTGADHRIALVGFAYSAYNNGKYKNTGLLAGAGGAKNYSLLDHRGYK